MKLIKLMLKEGWPLLGHHLWNYSKGEIELGREMINYTGNNVSYVKGGDIRPAFLY